MPGGGSAPKIHLIAKAGKRKGRQQSESDADKAGGVLPHSEGRTDIFLIADDMKYLLPEKRIAAGFGFQSFKHFGEFPVLPIQRLAAGCICRAGGIALPEGKKALLKALKLMAKEFVQPSAFEQQLGVLCGKAAEKSGSMFCFLRSNPLTAVQIVHK